MATHTFVETSPLQNLNNLILKYGPEELSPSKAANRPEDATLMSTFPLLSLPLELLHQIGAHYYANLPALALTSANLDQPLHAHTPLALSSPQLLARTLPPSLYYHHATFLFSSPRLLKDFAAALGPRAENVRRARILYGGCGGCGGCGGGGSGGSGGGGDADADAGKGHCGGGSGDWVYCLLESLPRLEEVVFVVQAQAQTQIQVGGCGEKRMGAWWDAVVDAFREGWAGRRSDGKAEGKILVVRVEVGGGEEMEARIGC
ncbi:hypothetical protein MBM_04378 [Drepanopeziza brunnea f. sp. 'multigermtubi' MB_m1]|uniref:Uncharacterized protein n=1 Tax=Marssonina brunnea f. sp. multigermtubi (strain MB_m1) TaxID=1072389 RepID=K1WY53_MARBU|nr:uncharacterized protein MBM_04378 [Drepanopeziza brunnea f. sp. 'multigermtubi' MB_m1]EKD17517.1 hypothetical protein MBM_04378 [Drepanopeziza brunnea f. sp. 'multigermtubi' MB_m1]